MNVSMALYNDQFTPSRLEARIYGHKWQPLLSRPCMLVLILPTSEGWKAEWILVGKKVAKYSTLGRTGIVTRDLRVEKAEILPLRQPLRYKRRRFLSLYLQLFYPSFLFISAVPLKWLGKIY